MPLSRQQRIHNRDFSSGSEGRGELIEFFSVLGGGQQPYCLPGLRKRGGKVSLFISLIPSKCSRIYKNASKIPQKSPTYNSHGNLRIPLIIPRKFPGSPARIPKFSRHSPKLLPPNLTLFLYTLFRFLRQKKHKNVENTKPNGGEGKNSCVGRESNPDQLLGRQLCSPLHHRRSHLLSYEERKEDLYVE